MAVMCAAEPPGRIRPVATGSLTEHQRSTSGAPASHRRITDNESCARLWDHIQKEVRCRFQRTRTVKSHPIPWESPVRIAQFQSVRSVGTASDVWMSLGRIGGCLHTSSVPHRTTAPIRRRSKIRDGSETACGKQDSARNASTSNSTTQSLTNKGFRGE